MYMLRDSWGYEKRCRHTFYAINKEDSSIILNLPALTNERIKINIVDRT